LGKSLLLYFFICQICISDLSGVSTIVWTHLFGQMLYDSYTNNWTTVPTEAPATTYPAPIGTTMPPSTGPSTTSKPQPPTAHAPDSKVEKYVLRLSPMRRNFWAGLAVFIFGLYGFIGFLFNGSAFYVGVVFLGVTVCSQVRIPAPLGVIGLPVSLLFDGAVMFLTKYDIPLAIICFAMFIAYAGMGATFAVCFLATIFFGMNVFYRRKLTEYYTSILKNRQVSRDPEMKPNTGTGVAMTSQSLLPFLLKLHPYFLHYVGYPASLVKHDCVEFVDHHVSVDIWRLQDHVIANFRQSTDIEAASSPMQAHVPVKSVPPAGYATVGTFSPTAYANMVDVALDVVNGPISPVMPCAIIDVTRPAASTTGGGGVAGKSTPIMFFVHGGLWKVGSSRTHTQVQLHADLIARGWIVISCNYRQDTWPNQLADTKACLEYVISHCVEWAGSVDNIHFMGASTGGHILTQVYCDMQCLLRHPFRPASMTLLYPVTDPMDNDHYGADMIPIPLDSLHTRPKQSMMSYLFESMVLKHKCPVEELNRWSPLVILTQQIELLTHAVTAANSTDMNVNANVNGQQPAMIPDFFYWPRTYLVHGELDSIVPCEQTILFHDKLRELRRLQAKLYARPNASAPPAPSAPFLYQQGQPIPQPQSFKSPQQMASPGAPIANPNRVQTAVGSDDFLLVPGGKHLFELSGCTTVNPVNNLIVDWLQH
jgi:acetyl esterase/lipase